MVDFFFGSVINYERVTVGLQCWVNQKIRGNGKHLVKRFLFCCIIVCVPLIRQVISQEDCFLWKDFLNHTVTY